MENSEAIQQVGVAPTVPERGIRERCSRGTLLRAVNRLKRRPLFQKVVIANTALIISGSTMGIYLEEQLLGGGFDLVLLFVAGGVAFSILVNCIMVKLAFRPLDNVVEALKAIRIGRRAIRVPEVRDDPQIGELSRSLNSMLDSLEQQRRKGAASAIKAQEEERKRIARELHDETSQSLTGLVIGIKVAEEMVPPSLPDIRERLHNIKDLAHTTLGEVHTMAVRLRPSVLDDLGLSAAIRSYIKEFTRNTRIFVDLRMKSMSGRLPSRLETVLYRVVQEALTNVARHSGAKGCRVSLERDKSTVKGTITDDGCGFSPEEVLQSDEGARGLGLHGMQERVELVDGSLAFESGPGIGTTIRLEVPIESKEGVW
ncbi:MAG: sensor histidine kinase [Gaiellales bacterium]|nr:MAG: sensor histidine kinase [Gaiellales bacterium]